MGDDRDPLDIPAFLRRDKGENPPPAGGGSCPTATVSALPMSHETYDRWEAVHREQRKAKSRGRVGRMLAKKADREALAAGKRWDVRTGRWV